MEATDYGLTIHPHGVTLHSDRRRRAVTEHGARAATEQTGGGCVFLAPTRSAHGLAYCLSSPAHCFSSNLPPHGLLCSSSPGLWRWPSVLHSTCLRH
jgi:hypothetical protein